MTRRGVEADEGQRCLYEESSYAHDSDNDELSSRTALCDSQSDKVLDQAMANLPEVENVPEPFVGMEFKSRDEAHEFYITYGRRTGFTVRIHHNRRSRIDNVVIGQDFVCSKEGFREKKYMCRKDRVLPPPPITRQGCPATLRLALREGVKWVVTKFVKEHCHELMPPSEVPLRGPLKNITSEDEKDQRIRELTLELYNERQKSKRRCAAYQEQLLEVLKVVEEHNEHMSKKVQDMVRRIKEFEQ